MPRFFFDSDDGEHLLVDDVGQDMPSFPAARDEAIRVLPDIARDMLPDGDERTFVSIIKDLDGKQICKATLVFRCDRLP
jgi:hypothetical protein